MPDTEDIFHGLDGIIFTAGIGENSDYMRQLVCKNLECFDIFMDNKLNVVRSNNPRLINTPKSSIEIAIIPTNEELEIAKQTYRKLI